MKELISYAEAKLDEHYNNRFLLFRKNFWEKLNDENCQNIESYLDESSPKGCPKCSYSSILEGTNGHIIAERIIKLSNQSRYNLLGYLRKRYYLPESHYSGKIEEHHLQDLDTLKVISDALNKKTKKLKLLDKFSTSKLIDTLDSCIKTLQNPNTSQ